MHPDVSPDALWRLTFCVVDTEEVLKETKKFQQVTNFNFRYLHKIVQGPGTVVYH